MHLIFSFFNIDSISNFDWSINPIFSEKNTFEVSCSSNSSKSICIPISKLEKHISMRVVINPPEPISCPDDIFLSLISF